MTKNNPRIYIDCSFIDFSKQPTGIPRVVLKYVEVGYKWGKLRGIDVIPVVPVVDGLVICRPVPGADPPQSLLDRVQRSEANTAPSGVRRVATAAARYVTNITHHLLYLAASVLPIPPVRATSDWIDGGAQRLCQSIERDTATARLDAIKFQPRQGDILFAPAYWHDVDPAIYASLRVKGLQVIILVHDLLPIAFQHFYPSPWRYQFKDNVTKAFNYASAFFCVSNLTRSTLAEFSYRQKTQRVPMMTSYNGFEPLVDDTTADKIREKTIEPRLGNSAFYSVCNMQPLLMVGSVEPKKGHIPVISCLEAMWSAGYGRALLIIGRPGWMERDVVEKIETSFFYNKKLFWFASIDDFDLAFAYLSCRALIFSSLAEGFGIPMIEASYYGKPTIALNTPIVQEILGSKGRLFTSAATFVRHLTEIEEQPVYEAACALAESLSWPSWDDYTPKVFDTMLRMTDAAWTLPEQIDAVPGAAIESGHIEMMQQRPTHSDDLPIESTLSVQG